MSVMVLMVWEEGMPYSSLWRSLSLDPTRVTGGDGGRGAQIRSLEAFPM